MTAKELMIGDWVQVRRKTGEWINCQCEREDFAWIDEEAEERISPYPITPEILEKNGWYRVKSVYDPSWCDWIHKKGGLFLSDYGKGCTIRIMGNLIVIKYVHELQHALRLCGMKELANNFKV